MQYVRSAAHRSGGGFQMGMSSADIDAIVAGRTVPSLFREMAANRGDAVAVRWRPDWRRSGCVPGSGSC